MSSTAMNSTFNFFSAPQSETAKYAVRQTTPSTRFIVVRIVAEKRWLANAKSGLWVTSIVDSRTPRIGRSRRFEEADLDREKKSVSTRRRLHCSLPLTAGLFFDLLRSG